MALLVRDDGAGGTLIGVKVVPGAKRDQLSGLLGDRLKIRTSAAPEGGKANRAVCALLAERLGTRSRDVSVAQGMTEARKIIRVEGMTPGEVRAALGC